MIWFACKQCGKSHGRPESSAGTLVFCECGAGNSVPWESTVPPPPVAEVVEAVPTPSAPRLQPIPIGEERVPPRKPAIPLEEHLPVGRPAPRRRPGGRRRDPRYCLNHEETPSVKTCADCGEGFCTACLAELKGQPVCAACKNFRVRVVRRPAQVSGLAITSILLGMLTGPLAICMLPLGDFSGSGALRFIALVPQLAALALGGVALYQLETRPRLTGRSLAITGVVAAAVGVVLTLTVMIFGARPLW
jgi:hypothetical protein